MGLVDVVDVGLVVVVGLPETDPVPVLSGTIPYPGLVVVVGTLSGTLPYPGLVGFAVSAVNDTLVVLAGTIPYPLLVEVAGVAVLDVVLVVPPVPGFPNPPAPSGD